MSSQPTQGPEAAPGRIRTTTLVRMKHERRPIVVMTAYDAITARWADSAGVDVILVGDSMGNTALGHPSTIPVTLDAMVHHCACVARGAGARPLLVGDLPFMTYKTSPEQAMASAARLVQEGGMAAVKLEGGREIAPAVERLTSAGIPVMGHLGLLPQSVNQLGGYRRQGTDPASAARLREDARALEAAGAFSLVLEMVPPDLADEVSGELGIPTIGIGAGPRCDGQVLVIHDVLGMGEGAPPRFVRQYANLWSEAGRALAQYAADVRAAKFPEEGDGHVE